jgi:L-ascorbate metabolism protein UlaG (beta-lactamase superfamily)
MIIKNIASGLLFIIFLNSCTAVKSTYNSFSSSIGSFFSSPEIVKNKISEPYDPDVDLSVLWIGHASLLIQIGDKFILTDPVLTETVGYFSRRLVEPGIDINNIPDIEVVLLSHLHIDHYSPASLDMIEKKINNLIVPLGGIVYLPDFDFSIYELGTYKVWEQDSLKITAVPVLHNGWRYGIDDEWMKTSYTGYVIEYKGISVYFGGDTGYDGHTFKETASHFEKIDLTLLPIAPIHPREYSRLRHTDPADALKIHKELGARWFIPMHYDTFSESYDKPGEAVKLMQEEANKAGLTFSEVMILEIGEQVKLIYN